MCFLKELIELLANLEPTFRSSLRIYRVIKRVSFGKIRRFSQSQTLARVCEREKLELMQRLKAELRTVGKN